MAQGGGEYAMAIKRGDHRISVGLPEWLYEDLRKLAQEAGPSWDVSKQVRFELLAHRGQAIRPTLPTAPGHEYITRKRKSA